MEQGADQVHVTNGLGRRDEAGVRAARAGLPVLAREPGKRGRVRGRCVEAVQRVGLVEDGGVRALQRGRAPDATRIEPDEVIRRGDVGLDVGQDLRCVVARDPRTAEVDEQRPVAVPGIGRRDLADQQVDVAPTRVRPVLGDVDGRALELRCAPVRVALGPVDRLRRVAVARRVEGGPGGTAGVGRRRRRNSRQRGEERQDAHDPHGSSHVDSLPDEPPEWRSAPHLGGVCRLSSRWRIYREGFTGERAPLTWSAGRLERSFSGGRR